jgi:hypothetical protein
MRDFKSKYVENIHIYVCMYTYTQGDQKVHLIITVQKNVKMFLKVSPLTMVTYLELVITDGVS